MAVHGLPGTTILIAGGAENAGGLIARDLTAQGAGAVAIHDSSAASEAAAVQADPTTAGAVDQLFAGKPASSGPPDIAINTVGKVLKQPFAKITKAEHAAANALVSALLSLDRRKGILSA